MLVFLIGAADAFDLVDEGVVAAADDEITAVAVADVDGDGAPDLVMSADGATGIVGDDGWGFPIEALALAPADLDGDGSNALLACTARGLFLLDPADGSRQVTSKACASLAVADLDGDGDDDVVTGGAAVLLWETVEGSPKWSTDNGLRLGTTPLLAAREGIAYAAEPGRSALWTLGFDLDEQTALDGVLRGLFATADGPAWVSTIPASLRLPSGAAVPLESGSTVLLGADWDDDGQPDLAVLDLLDGIVTFVDPRGEVVIGLAAIEPGARLPAQVAFADEDGDGCPDLAIALGSELSLLRGDCTVLPSPDDDGDGWTAAGRDCDDTDPDVHPGAQELCNGIDDDCDEVVDEYSLALSDATLLGREGHEVALAAYHRGCVSRTAWRIEDPDNVLYCWEDDDGDLLTCTLLDDGDAHIEFVVTAEDGSVFTTRHADVEVSNAAPGIVGLADRLTVHVGGALDLDVPVTDPGERDTFTWSLTGAPPGMTIHDGHLSWRPTEHDVGPWPLAVRVEDDDGASASATLAVSVVQQRPVGLCGLCWSSTAAGLLLPMALLTGARRRGAAGRPG